MAFKSIGGSKGVLGMQSNLFHFHAVFGKKSCNIIKVLASNSGVGAPAQVGFKFWYWLIAQAIGTEIGTDSLKIYEKFNSFI